MNPRSLTIVTLAALALVACDEPAGSGSGAAPAEPVDVRLFGVERGIVHYALAGMFEGTETLYFDRWGARQATWTTRRMVKPVARPEEQTLVLHDAGRITTVDLVARTGTRVSSPLWDKLLAVPPGERAAALARLTGAMGGKPAGVETFLERPCEVTEVPMLKQRILTWNGLTLKNTSEMTGASTVATSIEVDVEIPADKLVIPEGTAVSEGRAVSIPKIPRKEPVPGRLLPV